MPGARRPVGPYALRPAGCAGAIPVKIKKNIHFQFDQELVREPLLYKINRTFDLVVNIRGASVTDQGGFIALELEGEQAEVERVLAYLRGQGVKLGEGLGSPER
jgi:ABC-type methionine transport system ATPase subunit